MEISYKTGDLLKAEEHFILQGCNAQGVMGSGVAKLIRDADENVFTAYRKVYEEQGNKLDLGQTIWVPSVPLQRVVINGITQKNYGKDPNTVYVSYDGVREVIRQINGAVTHLSIHGPVDAVGMPLIGAGLAHGKWEIISKIIEEEATNFQPVVYLIDGKIPQ